MHELHRPREGELAHRVRALHAELAPANGDSVLDVRGRLDRVPPLTLGAVGTEEDLDDLRRHPEHLARGGEVDAARPLDGLPDGLDVDLGVAVHERGAVIGAVGRAQLVVGAGVRRGDESTKRDRFACGHADRRRRRLEPDELNVTVTIVDVGEVDESHGFAPRTVGARLRAA